MSNSGRWLAASNNGLLPCGVGLGMCVVSQVTSALLGKWEFCNRWLNPLRGCLSTASTFLDLGQITGACSQRQKNHNRIEHSMSIELWRKEFWKKFGARAKIYGYLSAGHYTQWQPQSPTFSLFLWGRVSGVKSSGSCWGRYSGKKIHTETRYVSLSFIVDIKFEFRDRLNLSYISL